MCIFLCSIGWLVVRVDKNRSTCSGRDREGGETRLKKKKIIHTLEPLAGEKDESKEEEV